MNDTKKNGSSRQQNKNRKQIQYTTILKCAAIFCYYYISEKKNEQYEFTFIVRTFSRPFIRHTSTALTESA